MRYSGLPVIGPSERLTGARLKGIGPTLLEEARALTERLGRTFTGAQ